ncbi:MAG: YitT family protein [Christensenellales bacterium]
MRSFRPYFSLGKCFLALAGSAILAFGLYNVHSFSNVTEGGVLGMTLLLHHWFGLSPSISGLVLNAACYIGGWRTLGRSFIFYSVIAGGGFSAFYAFLSSLIRSGRVWRKCRWSRRSSRAVCRHRRGVERSRGRRARRRRRTGHGAA